MDYAFYFAITIGILVFVHEFGHFAAAKLSGMRADVFAVGFGRRLLGWNRKSGFSFGNLPKDFDGEGHTDYRLCMLPLGGYVKIAGMVDESFDTEFADKDPQPYEFRAKSTIAKLFVITAGVMMNLTLTFLIFWGINFDQGKAIISTTQIGAVAEESIAADLGFQSKDKILNVNGTEVEDWDALKAQLLYEHLGEDISLKVERNGELIDLFIPKEKLKDITKSSFFLDYSGMKPLISDVLPNSPAEDAGVKTGDFFLELNGEELASTKQVISIISSHPEIEMPLTILRGEDTIRTAVTPGREGMIGISLVDMYAGPVKKEAYGFFEAGLQSFTDIGKYTMLTYTMLKTVIAGDIAFNRVFGGPVKIAQFASRSADNGLMSFLFFLASLSLSLAIINILPFPVLDGGHFVIILIEGLLKRELPIKVKIAIQNTGFIILLLLMAFIIYSDIISL